MDFPDEMIRCSIHEHEFKQLSKTKKALLEEYRDIEFYPQGLKKGKKFDKVKEFKRLIREYIKHTKDKPENNIECIVIDQMQELLERMMAHHVRKLGLEKLL
jgi:hypothetical protein